PLALPTSARHGRPVPARLRGTGQRAAPRHTSPEYATPQPWRGGRPERPAAPQGHTAADRIGAHGRLRGASSAGGGRARVRCASGEEGTSPGAVSHTDARLAGETSPAGRRRATAVRQTSAPQRSESGGSWRPGDRALPAAWQRVLRQKADGTGADTAKACQEVGERLARSTRSACTTLPPGGSDSVRWLRSPLQTSANSASTANGGDNLSVFVPVLAVMGPGDLLTTVVVFAVMTAVWCAAAY